MQTQIAFGHLGVLDGDQSNDFTKIEKLTSKIFGNKYSNKIDDVRTETCMKKLVGTKIGKRWEQNILCQKT